jgi:hypothetical protein
MASQRLILLQRGVGVGELKRPFLSWIFDIPIHGISMAENDVQPKPALDDQKGNKCWPCHNSFNSFLILLEGLTRTG